MRTLTKVQYLRRVTSPRSMVGRPGEMKTLPEHEADQLVGSGYAQIIEAGIPLPVPPEVEDPPGRDEEPFPTHIGNPTPAARPRRKGRKPKPTGMEVVSDE